MIEITIRLEQIEGGMTNFINISGLDAAPETKWELELGKKIMDRTRTFVNSCYSEVKFASEKIHDPSKWPTPPPTV